MINITTGGGARTCRSRSALAAPLPLQPEMCSLNMGSMNFVLSEHGGAAVDDWKFEWEQTYPRERPTT